MKIQHFFDKETATFSYVVIDEKTKKCAVIDSVLDFNQFSGKISTKSADQIIVFINQNNLQLEWILETHIHADHLTAASYIQEKIGGKIAIGEKISEILKFWVPIFNSEKDTPLDGSQFDRLFKDGEKFQIGELEVKVLHTPGHTPACVCYLIKDAIFVGDTIFNPHLGTARADFPGGSAKNLYNSIQKIFDLPDETRIFVGHDYPQNGEEPKCHSLVLEQKNANILVKSGISEEEYISVRNKRDERKDVPKLLLPSIQVNLRAGKFGEAEINGVNYIKIPISKF